MTSKVFCIDYDETISNTDRMRRDITDAIAQLGGDPVANLYLEAYEAVRAEQGIPRMPRILKLIANQGGIEPTLHFQLADLFHTFPYQDYIYPGAKDLIRHLKNSGKVVLFSDGDAFFQAHKIHSSSLASLVDSVIILPNKIACFDDLHGFWPSEQYVFIDDKQKVLTAAKEHFGNKATTVLVKQGRYADGDHINQADHIIPTIADAITLF
jgi:phosphoglycolate phosphatase-like HAD superfamily hydrolase